MDEWAKKRRGEILRRLEAEDGLPGRPAARREPGEEDREPKNKLEK